MAGRGFTACMMYIATYKQHLYRRLKRRQCDQSREHRDGLDEIFSDDDAPYDMDVTPKYHLRPDLRADKFGDFIEEDDFEDNDQKAVLSGGYGGSDRIPACTARTT